jgi:hypothetical protein
MNHKRKFPFSKAGISFYEKVTLSEIMQALENGTIDNYEIQIKIGENYISIPLYAEAYESTIEYLKTTLKEIEQ